MTTHPPVSVIVVSRHRPADLDRCLSAIRKQDHPNFELVVVADPDAVARIAMADAKVVPFDDANISAARNLGLAQAAGQIVAFIDDDAMAEPRWLSRLTAPFSDPEIAAAGGFVVGRNGISFQWKASVADRHGRSTPIEVDPAEVTVLKGAPDRAIRTEGTNCAFRRDVLVTLGGFDPAYRFYLDETDLNMRMALAGLQTAIVPRARVHHAYSASDRRGADRTPADLTEIGASLAVYLRKFAPAEEHAAAIAAFREGQGAWLAGFRRKGLLDAAGTRRLLSTLDNGVEAGLARDIGRPDFAMQAPPPFRRLAGGDGRIIYRSGWTWRSGRLTRSARQEAGTATAVVMLFGPTVRYHRLRFTGTHWEQRGGLFGKSDRTDPIFRIWTRRSRFNRERIRLDF